MIVSIAAFEVRQRLRAVSTYVYFAVLTALSVFFVAATGGAVKGAIVDFGTGSRVNVNAPFTLTAGYVLIASFGTPIVAAIAGRAVYQDIDHRSTALFFTAPISEFQYLAGRFLGAFVVVLALHAGIVVGAFACIHGGLIDAARLGAETPLSYLQPYAIALVPNLFFTCAFFFSLATLLRKMMPVYVGGVLLTLGYFIGTNLAGDATPRLVAALIDPFGLLAVERFTAYWTVAERSSRLVPLVGLVAANRLLWTGFGAALLVVTKARFRFDEPRVKSKKSLSDLETPNGATPGAEPARELASRMSPSRGLSTAPSLPVMAVATPRHALRLIGHLTRLQLRETVKNVFFLVLVLAGLLFILAQVLDGEATYGVKTYPVTYIVLEVVEQGFGIFVTIITAFYAGELTWRERDARLSEIVDALPVPGAVLFLSKLFALFLVEVLLLSLVIGAGVLTQTILGYHAFELSFYLQKVFLVSLPRFLMLSTLAMTIHAVVDNKYVGHFVMVLYILVAIALPLAGFEDHLYRFATPVEFRYSAMNGFGHYVEPIAWLLAYWAAASVFLAGCTYLLWVRGTERGITTRLRQARARLTKPPIAVLATSGAVFVAIGSFIYFNTHVLNRFRSSFDKDEDLATYEKKYKSYENEARPTSIAHTLEVDIDPPSRSAALRGTYRLENRTALPLSRVAVTVDPRANIEKLEFDGGARRSLADPAIGFFVFDLEHPLAPGAQIDFRFAVSYRPHGFVVRGSDTHFVGNGTFFTWDYFPAIGYRNSRELPDDESRRRHGLSPKRLLAVDDPVGIARSNGGTDIDWISLDATVSTTPDQIAIAPGVLDREWSASGRRYFHYRVPGPMLSFYGFLSGRYVIHRDRWNDVAIEIDHHPGHDYNLGRMVDSIKGSLDYLTTNFGPYQHKQVRIVEFPRYERMAMSLAAMIPYSESIGFIARVDERDRKDVDFPFYVTSHEVAHQWWAHQIIGADVQGGEVLSESLCQYTALMVMKQRYGAAMMGKFLRHELDRYLRGRGLAKKREQPLARVESDGYIHYNKGSLVMYALQDQIGEDVVNGVLRRLLERHRFRGAPYPTTEDLVRELVAAAPQARTLVDDLFEQITLYDNQVVKATVRDVGGERHEVHIEAIAKKLHADELGDEKEAPLDDFIDVGALDANGKVIALEKIKVTNSRVDVTMEVRGAVAQAGIDPRNMLIDRKPEDNVADVVRE